MYVPTLPHLSIYLFAAYEYPVPVTIILKRKGRVHAPHTTNYLHIDVGGYTIYEYGRAFGIVVDVDGQSSNSLSNSILRLNKSDAYIRIWK